MNDATILPCGHSFGAGGLKEVKRMVNDSLTNPMNISCFFSYVNLANPSFDDFFVVRKHVLHVLNLLQKDQKSQICVSLTTLLVLKKRLKSLQE